MSKRFTSSSNGSGAGLIDWSRRPGTAYASISSPVASRVSLKGSIAEKYSLGPSPEDWGLPLHTREPDDEIHNPDGKDSRGSIFTMRGLSNLGCLVLLVLVLVTLFAGYPLLTHILKTVPSTRGGFNIGGLNASGQVPDLPGNLDLIDRDTPQEAYTKPSYHDPSQEMVLVFSDEFETDGRSFYPGDDPFWEAVDLYYWATEDLEWYDPSQVTTQGGSLRLTMEEVLPINNHNMSYRSGMIQSWNKFCFTGGILEAKVMLPGSPDVSGLWPAVWSMGNLGRAGFGGSLEGMWPYTYDECDVGTLPNQTYPGTLTPLAAYQGGDPTREGQLSLLQGQKLSACTCSGESHPGPMRTDGSYVGRAAPEIDVFEAIVEEGVGKVSLSSQWAPFNAEYAWNTDQYLILHDSPNTTYNTFKGNALQQTTSGLALTNSGCYERSEACYALYGFEYKTGFDEGYMTWVNDDRKSWTLLGPGLDADPVAEIGKRQIPVEPMYIIANLGLSPKFGIVDFQNLVFPTVMSIDYIRVYQPAGQVNIGCDPKDYPTAKYIETYKDAYTNSNYTSWAQAKQPWPKNRLVDQC